MNDDDYATALWEELCAVRRDLEAARQEREQGRKLLQHLQDEQASLRLQKDQRTKRNDLLDQRKQGHVQALQDLYEAKQEYENALLQGVRWPAEAKDKATRQSEKNNINNNNHINNHINNNNSNNEAAQERRQSKDSKTRRRESDESKARRSSSKSGSMKPNASPREAKPRKSSIKSSPQRNDKKPAVKETRLGDSQRSLDIQDCRLAEEVFPEFRSLGDSLQFISFTAENS
jgi:hypothetical protein